MCSVSKVAVEQTNYISQEPLFAILAYLCMLFILLLARTTTKLQLQNYNYKLQNFI